MDPIEKIKLYVLKALPETTFEDLTPKDDPLAVPLLEARNEACKITFRVGVSQFGVRDSLREEIHPTLGSAINRGIEWLRG